MNECRAIRRSAVVSVSSASLEQPWAWHPTTDCGRIELRRLSAVDHGHLARTRGPKRWTAGWLIRTNQIWASGRRARKRSAAALERDPLAFLFQHQVIAVGVGELHEVTQFHVVLLAGAQVLDHGFGHPQLVGQLAHGFAVF